MEQRTLILALLLSATFGPLGCGSESSGNQSPQDASSCSDASASLQLNSPLPAALGPTCTGADLATLEGLLLFGANQNCTLSVTDQGVSGTCGCVEKGQSFYADLTYRLASTKHSLLTQSQFVEIGQNSADTFVLAFSDKGNSNEDNLNAFCTGTLP